MENTKISESIYSSKTVLIPMADVQHVEKVYTKEGELLGLKIITCHTRWDREYDGWANNAWVDKDESEKFIQAYCYFRNEKDIKTPEASK